MNVPRTMLRLATLAVVGVGFGLAFSLSTAPVLAASSLAHPMPPALGWVTKHAAALLASPACTPSSDPQTCINAFLSPLNRPFQIVIGFLLSIIGAISLITGLVSLARGGAGGIFNQPRWVSIALTGVGGALFLFVVALVLVNVFGNLNGLVPTPSLPNLGGGG